ncbi:MAG: hypothetical protein RMJ44_02865 [Cytophagales bacterium]|nr:hypothetical protein [Bernardetiaceae bacterium]MDW8210004.1 hypothetical protein [Cytophagales bacterium]
MNHPYLSIPQQQYIWLIIITSLFTFLLTAGQIWVNMSLVNDAAPAGMLSLQFAGNLANARLIIHSWDYIAKMRAAFGIGLDFLYIVAYSTALGLLCVYVAHWWTFLGSWGKIGIPLGWLQWLAAALDGVENLSLIALLCENGFAWLPWLAYWAAVVKFSIIGLALLYLLAGFFVLWWRVRLDG